MVEKHICICKTIKTILFIFVRRRKRRFERQSREIGTEGAPATPRASVRAAKPRDWHRRCPSDAEGVNSSGEAARLAPKVPTPKASVHKKTI
jgi:hypothetical protein